jgi:hypothetical protein
MRVSGMTRSPGRLQGAAARSAPADVPVRYRRSPWGWVKGWLERPPAQQRASANTSTRPARAAIDPSSQASSTHRKRTERSSCHQHWPTPNVLVRSLNHELSALISYVKIKSQDASVPGRGVARKSVSSGINKRGRSGAAGVDRRDDLVERDLAAADRAEVRPVRARARVGRRVRAPRPAGAEFASVARGVVC